MNKKKKDSTNREVVGIGITEFYRFYKNNLKSGKGSINKELLDEKTYKRVAKKFWKKCRDKILDGFKMSFPSHIGDIYVIGYKKKLKLENGEIKKNRYNINYKATKELWKSKPELTHKKWVYYENHHSDGLQYKIKRARFSYNRKVSVFNFSPARDFSRTLAQKIFKERPQYYEEQ